MHRTIGWIYKNKLLAGLFIFLFLLPLAWFRPERILGKGDLYPIFFSLSSESWSPDNLGAPSASPAYTILKIFWDVFSGGGLETGFIQIIFLMICFGIAGFSMSYLSKQIFPKKKIAPVLAGLFYVLNFFTFSIISNIGLIWTYAWLPLLIALLIKTLTTKEKIFRNSLIFSFTFSFVASVASLNFANVVLIILGLGAVFLYHGVASPATLKQSLKTVLILSFLSILFSVWWIAPNVNYFMPSATFQLQQDVNVQSWSWTHQRASLLNLFSLNAGWSWRAEYTPHYQIYSENLVLSFLLIVPFFFGTIAMFVKEKRRMNTYHFLLILFFLFLAKGLHEPFSSFNLFLYDYIPFMSMFREPVSKFTLIAIPFLTLLIGYSADKLVAAISSRFNKRFFISIFSIIGIAIILISPTFPLLADPLETKTEQIPYSTYVDIPQYWYETNQWLNNQTGEFRVLLTPLNDYYQMPYMWGYYGTDSIFEGLIDKPVVCATSLFSYQVNPNMVALMDILRRSIEINESLVFEECLSILNVKYIIVKNDIDYEYLELMDRHVTTNSTIKSFLATHSAITMVKQIGAIDIYKLNTSENTVHFLPIQHIGNNENLINYNTSSLETSFDTIEQLNLWKNFTLTKQFEAECNLSLDQGTLKFEILNSTWGWKVINSPLILADREAKYSISFNAKGANVSSAHVKVFQFNEKMETVKTTQYSLSIDSTASWIKFQTNEFSLFNETKYLQVQIWSGHLTETPLPNIIWIDDFRVNSTTSKINPIMQELIKESYSENIQILNFSRVSPTKIVVTINNSEPSTLILNEAYDKNWQALINEHNIESSSLFSLNSFRIDHTGLLTIIVEYKSQNLFYYAVTLSATSAIGAIIYILLVNRTSKQRLDTFIKYSKQNLHFYSDPPPSLLKKGVLITNNRFKRPSFLDIGCGDGRLIYALSKKDLLPHDGKVIAVDLSAERLKHLANSFDFVQTINSDALNVKLNDGSIDLIICSQLIEHLDDKKLIEEILRLLKPNGLLFLSSVLKSRYAIYYYYRNGKFLLDPTHVKEYSSEKEFLKLITRDFKVIDCSINRISFPLFDQIIRILIKVGFRIDSKIYLKNKKISALRLLKLPIPGYRNIEVLAQKNSVPPIDC